MKWITILLSFLNGIGICNPYVIGTSFLIYFGINLVTLIFDELLVQIETMLQNWKQKDCKSEAFDLAFSAEEDKCPYALKTGIFHYD